MCSLFRALELSKTIKKIEAAEIYFKALHCFDCVEILSDLKFKKIELLERLIGQEWEYSYSTSELC